jgi:hypothetical protein
MRFFIGVALVSGLSLAAPLSVPVPPETPEVPTSGLLAKVLRYEGNSHGQMLLSLENPTKGSVLFSAAGLYFVPDMQADVAPQRLGAVGGFDIEKTRRKNSTRAETLTLAAGEKVTLRLDVYCIDHQRPAPNSQTPYRLGLARLPKELVKAIDVETQPVARQNGGFSDERAKSAVQGLVWENRNKNWVKLDGEGAREAGFQEGQPTPKMNRAENVNGLRER